MNSGNTSSTASHAICQVFNVSDVTIANTPLPEIAYKSAIEALLAPPPVPKQLRHCVEPTSHRPARPTRQVEACTRYHGSLVDNVNFHPFVAAVDLAFRGHRPIVLSPDMLWLLLAQGVANHINAHAEELRHQFVAHTGKATLIVRREDFLKGSPENPWSEVIYAFREQLREHIGPTTHDMFQPRFSTTTQLEQTAAVVVLMDAMQSYFSYEFHTKCGIPQVVLEGTLADWEQLAERAESMGRFGPAGWSATLSPILHQFVAAARGDIHTDFWNSFYKSSDASGGPYITGWITAFFPYLKSNSTGLATTLNPWLEAGGERLEKLLDPHSRGDRLAFPDGPTTEAFPSGLARAPFVWKYYDEMFNMEFLAGFVGVAQDTDTLRLRPEIGWAIVEEIPNSTE